MEYTFNMIETRTYAVKYTVEADSREEAENMAVIGDTIDEEGETLLSVIDREIEGEF
jgi:hypothetical protein